MELREGLKRLLGLAGVDSVLNNLQREDDAVWRNTEAAEQERLGKYYKPPAAGGSDEMRVTAARDVTVNHYSNNPNTAKDKLMEKAAETGKSLSKMALAAMIGSSMLGGGGIVAAVMAYLNRPAPVVQPVDPDSYNIGGQVVPVEPNKET